MGQGARRGAATTDRSIALPGFPTAGVGGSKTSQIVEADLCRLYACKHGPSLLVEVAKQSISEAIIRYFPKLFFYVLQSLTQCFLGRRTPWNGSHIQMSWEHRGEPTHRSR